MSQTNPAQQAARAAAAATEQLAAKAVVQSQVIGHREHGPRRYPMFNTIIVLGILLAAIGSFLALVLRAN